MCPGFRGVGLLEWHLVSDAQGGTGRRGYPAESRRRVLHLIASDRCVGGRRPRRRHQVRRCTAGNIRSALIWPAMSTLP